VKEQPPLLSASCEKTSAYHMADDKPFPSLAKPYHHHHFITHVTMGFLRADHFLPPYTTSWQINDNKLMPTPSQLGVQYCCDFPSIFLHHLPHALSRLL